MMEALICPTLSVSDLDIIFHGSDALLKYSPVVGFSYLDDPIDRIERNPLKVSVGSVAIFAMSQTKVARDLTSQAGEVSRVWQHWLRLL